MQLLKKLPWCLAGNRGARGSGDTSKNVIVGSRDKKDKFFSLLSPSLVKILSFFPSMLAKTGLLLQIQVPRVFRRSKVLLHIVPLSLDTSLLLLRKSLRIQSFSRMSLVWSVCVRARSHSDRSPAHLSGTCLSTCERKRSLVPDLVAVSQECSLDRSHDGISVSDPAEFVFVANPSAVRVGNSLVEAGRTHYDRQARP